MEMPSVILTETSSMNGMPSLHCYHNQGALNVEEIIALSAKGFRFGKEQISELKTDIKKHFFCLCLCNILVAFNLPKKDMDTINFVTIKAFAQLQSFIVFVMELKLEFGLVQSQSKDLAIRT